MGCYAPPGAPPREYDRIRYRKLREAGSCRACGAEAMPGRVRCLPCAQKNAASMRRLREERARAKAQP
jgi:formate dehydrogenase maturation protein FdhE